MLLLGKERQVTTFKQNTEVLAFLSGTALGHALELLQRKVIVNLEPHIHPSLALLSLFPLNSPLFLNTEPYSSHQVCSRDWEWDAY